MDDVRGGAWLTYTQAGKRFGISPEAARQLAKRRKWQRRTPNEPNAPAQMFVPADAYVRPRTPVTTEHRADDQPVANAHNPPDERNATIEIAALRARLQTIEADREHERRIAAETINDLRRRLDQVTALLLEQRRSRGSVPEVPIKRRRRWWRLL